MPKSSSSPSSVIASTRKPGSLNSLSSNSVPSLSRGPSSLEAFDSHENGEAPCRAGGYLSERGQMFTRPSSLRIAVMLISEQPGAVILSVEFRVRLHKV
jgi:hypothetical protein